MEEDKINNCWWGYECSQTWNTLEKTLKPDIRFCHKCKKDVFKTDSEDELVENIKLNRCMYFSESLLMPEDEKKQKTRTLGTMPRKGELIKVIDRNVLKSKNTPSNVFGKDITF